MNLIDIAKTLDQAAASAQATQQVSTTTSFSEADAYEIQRLSLEERYVRGEKFVGLKLGFTSFAKMEQMGVHDMIWGRLTDAMWYKSGDDLPLEKFIHPRAEPEIAFLLKKDLDREFYINKIKDLKTLPKLVEQTLLTENKIQTVSSTFTDVKGSMFLGRGFSYPIALEGALKLKELAYVHAEGYPAGEMKHGPLALIEDGMPVVVLAPRDNYYNKTISNMQEVIARGAKVLLITNKSKDEVVSENIWETIEVENTNDDLLPFLLTIPLQKLAYYSALKKGYDIDKPRNLAKSVTVE